FPLMSALYTSLCIFTLHTPSLSTPFFLYISILFFFNDTATTEIYTLSLHDALPIFLSDFDGYGARLLGISVDGAWCHRAFADQRDRKSTRLNSSHGSISYAVFCLKKKKKINQDIMM